MINSIAYDLRCDNNNNASHEKRNATPDDRNDGRLDDDAIDDNARTNVWNIEQSGAYHCF